MRRSADEVRAFLKSDAEAVRIVRLLGENTNLIRASYAGEPFRLEPYDELGRTFDETTVLRMIEAGALYASNASDTFKGGKVGVEFRPWRARITAEALKVRDNL